MQLLPCWEGRNSAAKLQTWAQKVALELLVFEFLPCTRILAGS